MPSFVQITAEPPGRQPTSKRPTRDWTAPFDRLSPAARLDRLADIEIAYGHERRATILAEQATALRAVTP